jgi:predicted lipid carrier protein YhbT
MNRTSPELPAVARLPLAWVPACIKSRGVARALNIVFAAALAEGELDFLCDRSVEIVVSDANVRFSLTLKARRFVPGDDDADLRIEGTLHTFLLLASRSEDADTLFFSRLLKSSGDTELGLYVKNFLAGLDPQSLPGRQIVEPAMKAALAVAGRFGARRKK